MYAIKRVNCNNNEVTYMDNDMCFTVSRYGLAMLPKQVALFIVRHLIMMDTCWDYNYSIEP